MKFIEISFKKNKYMLYKIKIVIKLLKKNSEQQLILTCVFNEYIKELFNTKYCSKILI